MGINKNATNVESGTESATNKAFVAPMKNIKIKVTNIKPMMIVLIKSWSDTRVLTLWSAVNVTFMPFGNTVASTSLQITCILSLASIRFSPLRFMTFSVITFLPSKRA